MVLGGLIIDAAEVNGFNDTMKKFRDEQNMHAELKWQKVTNQKLKQYKRFIEYFFALVNTDMLHFHSLIIDNNKVDHRKFNRNDHEVGFYKFYYQLLLHCFGKLYWREDEEDRFITYFDERTSSYSLSDLKDILNRGMRKKFPKSKNPFVSIEPLDSKSTDLIQIADIILGAIGFQKNGYELLAHSRQAKKELSSFIAESAGLRDLKQDSPRGNHRFTIWNFKLQ